MTRRTMQQIREAHDRLVQILSDPETHPAVRRRGHPATAALRWALGMTGSDDLSEVLGLDKIRETQPLEDAQL